MRTYITRTSLFIFVLCAALGTSVHAQLIGRIGSVRPLGGWPAETIEVYQPIVTDSTLLLTAPWLVWQCTCGADIDIDLYYEVDFRRMRKCWGRKEVFDRVEVNGVYSFVQRGLGQLYATLEPRGDGFQYTEVSLDSAETAKPLRTSLWVLDMDHVVRTDTSTQFQYNSEELTTRLTRYVQLIPMPWTLPLHLIPQRHRPRAEFLSAHEFQVDHLR